jgi:hypothetical protein
MPERRDDPDSPLSPAFVDFSDRPDAELPDGAVELERKPRPGERVADGKLVMDRVALVDSAMPAGHIETAHAIKLAEAALILSGHELRVGLLVREAKRLKTPLAELAESVYANAEEFIAAEVERRAAKSKG